LSARHSSAPTRRSWPPCTGSSTPSVPGRDRRRRWAPPGCAQPGS
jgi:hypothetical protein